ncbi:MAG: hypothetical protein JRJ69_01930 [Deltaproteobacteria bacterium]|nr:hypothetical protein [Deltaproteobacteria bacterium]MBW1736324.1 hypothetical protein [Deltaproteobacteria bacterium]MBW1909005.1 hypothetical protein [Deltaproteobacteria bacterium]MBW2033099.1 hypothetical protein [Deltaproteobacteria bacterium]MBW2113746.1 hypothetical protein [Deltaproteobacteria bacterium]
MKCVYHPDKDAIAQCSQCKKPLCVQCAIREGAETFICSRCAALKASQDAVQDVEQRIEEKESKSRDREEKKKRKSRLWIAAQLIILFVCVSIVVVQAPKLISAFTEKEKPFRYGTYSTDSRTDQCINNLWRISKLLQQGQMPGKDIVCPVSKRPYMVTTVDGDLVVRCPNPVLHGFEEIMISKTNPMPELIK